MRRGKFSVLWLSVLLFGAFPQPAPAATFTEVTEYFRPASGVVVMPAGDEILIDLDAAKGIREGDLLTVIVPGEKIIHPVTGEQLGSLDEVKAVLQVIQVKNGYSHAKPLGKAAGVERGDPVRRWSQVPAAFRSEGEDDGGRHRRVRAALPHLDWRPAGKDALLLFAFKGEVLEAYGPNRVLLASFPLGKALGPPTAGLAGASAATEAPAPGIIRQEMEAGAGVWRSPELAGEIVGVHVADFDGDGRQEIAAAFPYRLELGRIVGGEYSQVASLDLGYGQKAVGMDGADLDGDGRPELFLTAASEGDLSSLAIAFVEGQLKIIKGNIPWYVRGVRLPGEGRVLLGQKMGRLERDFDGPIFRLVWRDGAPAEGAALDLPRNIDLFGFAPVTGKDGQSLYADLTALDELQIVDAAGETIWHSSERVGGSEAFVERLDPAKDPAEGPATRNAFVPARLATAPDGTLLVPVNEGSRVLRRVRSFDRSHLRAMVWNGFALQEVWRTSPQPAYLADFRLADADNDGQAEIVQALVFARKGFLSKGRSALAIFELQ
ncbi:MAG: VCBS repeat-containing protein [Desulfuromonadales bacterium]